MEKEENRYCIKHEFNYLDNEFEQGCPECIKQRQEPRPVDARVIRRLDGKLEDGLYKNRLGEIRSVKRDDFLKDYPFRDSRLTAYDENGKLYKNRESDFDLVEAL